MLFRPELVGSGESEVVVMIGERMAPKNEQNSRNQGGM